MHRHLEQDLASFELTMPQFMSLNCILRNGSSCTMSEIAESSHHLPATLTGIIDRLYERGLVTRERDPRDRRSLRVALTQSGRDLLEQVDNSKKAWMANLLKGLSPEERRALIESTGHYLRLVEEELTPA
jgi:DNA-binding MarR family transcriptional regulator